MFFYPELAEIFEAAFPLVSKILVTFDDRHPIFRSFTKYFSGKKSVDQHQATGDWMCMLNLVPTPELEAALSKPLLRPLNLNGDMVEDLITGCVVRYPSDGPATLAAMFAVIPLTSVQSGVLTQQMLKFNADHATYDRDYRPPTYRSIFKPTVVIPVVLKQEGSEEVEEKVYGGYEKEPGHGNKAEAKKEDGSWAKEASGSGGELTPTLVLWNSAVVSTKDQHVDLHVSSLI
ncbi:hypothetical protein DFH07DRAFT_781955 [Mycena maculata]|uniref:Uncharacterized protein n=1 Tax=Mycena maculata TaxID=230809 RepID=A0AAD7HVQ0_9AGAR|nr:hypothetical protein DFH07DRAFT_781955 [Mycena maculata]